MTAAFADLHTHTHYSDGSDAPAAVVERAAELDVTALAITDHDTTAGLEEAEQAAESRGIAFLRGTEISAEFDRCEVHIVGLGVKRDCEELEATLERLRQERDTRAQRIAERLANLGIQLDLNKLAAGVGGAIGRMHVARELHDMGVVRSVQQAFDAYLNPGRRAYVGKYRVSCAEAIASIHAAGGLAFLAHPGIGSLHRHLPRLLQLPFDGIEAYHSKHSPGQLEQFIRIADERRILVGGGSDCHGTIKNAPEMGKVRMPMARYEAIREALGRG